MKPFLFAVKAEEERGEVEDETSKRCRMRRARERVR